MKRIDLYIISCWSFEKKCNKILFVADTLEKCNDFAKNRYRDYLDCMNAYAQSEMNYLSYDEIEEIVNNDDNLNAWCNSVVRYVLTKIPIFVEERSELLTKYYYAVTSWDFQQKLTRIEYIGFTEEDCLEYLRQECKKMIGTALITTKGNYYVLCENPILLKEFAAKNLGLIISCTTDKNIDYFD